MLCDREFAGKGCLNISSYIFKKKTDSEFIFFDGVNQVNDKILKKNELIRSEIEAIID